MIFARSARLPFCAGAIAAVLLFASQAFGQGAKAPPEVTATSVYVINADTGEPLYRKNEGKQFRMLSLTKLLTAHVLVHRLGDRLSETVTIKSSYLTTGSSAGLRKGDVWTLQDLLYGLVLVSGNDAALAIADHTGRALLAEEGKRGDPTKRFVKEMGLAAASLGAKNARFADPHGLSRLDVASAKDVAQIGASVFRDARVLPAWHCARRMLDIGGPNARSVTLDSTIEILGDEGVIAGKTGTHVGNNIYNLIVGWRAPNGQTIVAVVLGSTSNRARYDDMRAILAALPRDFPNLAESAGAARARIAETCPTTAKSE